MDGKKERCGHCRKQVLILIECPLCHRRYCIQDRVPESHMCGKMEAYKERPILVEKISTPKMEYI